jgi:hypothetical protein
MVPPRRRPWWARLVLALGAGLGAAVLIAIGLTVTDVYLSGHGQPTLGRPWLDLESLGVHLSRADVVFLVAFMLGAALAWRGTTAGGA